MALFVSALLCVALLPLVGAQIQSRGPMHNNVQTCKADTSGMVRRGNHLRERGDCQQGYMCDGNEIKPFREPCDDGTYFSVHTGVCSTPNVYSFMFSSFNCSAEEDDPNLDFENLQRKREELCEPLMRQADTSDLKELYVGDPDDCRQMYKCPLVAEHDDWLHMCPPGYKFQEGVEGPCTWDIDGCGWRRR